MVTSTHVQVLDFQGLEKFKTTIKFWKWRWIDNLKTIIENKLYLSSIINNNEQLVGVFVAHTHEGFPTKTAVLWIKETECSLSSLSKRLLYRSYFVFLKPGNWKHLKMWPNRNTSCYHKYSVSNECVATRVDELVNRSFKYIPETINIFEATWK